jgi:hypothetical protein
VSLLVANGSGATLMDGVDVGDRKAITRALAVKYRSGTRAAKSEILDTLCGGVDRLADHSRHARRWTGCVDERATGWRGRGLA